MKRNTRNYKDKKPLLTFGQFILPLTVIMAVALLFFSIKLFFLSPEDVQLDDEKETPKREAVKSPDVKEDAPAVKKEEPKPVKAEKIVVAKPVTPAKPATQAEPKPAKTGPVKNETQKTEPKKNAETKPTTPVAAPKKPQTPPSEPAKTAHRWDVQIGGFASGDSAKALLNKASSEGYDAYMTESKRDGAPFYKVRVKGAPLREDAANVAAKLQTAGYPVYLVEIKK